LLKLKAPAIPQLLSSFRFIHIACPHGNDNSITCCIADAVQRFGNGARLTQLHEESPQSGDEILVALAAWLNKVGRPAKALEVLP